MPPPAGTSQSWTSPTATQAAKLQRLQNNANHLGFCNSPLFPRNLGEYMRHQMEYAGDLAEKERLKLERKVGELQGKRRVEVERVEMRGEVERIKREIKGGQQGEGEVEMVEEFDDFNVGEEGEEVAGQDEGGEENVEDKVDLPQLHEEKLQEDHAGKIKATDNEAEVTGAEIEANGAESKEQIEGTEIESPESGEKVTAMKTKKNRKKQRGKGGKGKAKEAVQEELKTTTAEIKSPTTKEHKMTNDMANTIAASAFNDPLHHGLLAGTAKPPNSSLWKAFMESPLYNLNGFRAKINGRIQEIPKPGHTPVLGAKTNVWAGDEQFKAEGKRDPKMGEHRAIWPELWEMKAEGQHRKEAGRERRLPLPRKDLMNRESVLAQMGDYSKLSEEEIDEKIRELEKKTGEDIPWFEREVIRYRDFDRLESVSKERREDEKRRRMGDPVLGPQGANAGTSAQLGTSPASIGPGYQYGQTYGMGHQNRGGVNTGGGLRGGSSNTGRGGVHHLPAQPKVINHQTLSYGADGPSDGKKPPLGGWKFGEEWLKQAGEWKDLLETCL